MGNADTATKRVRIKAQRSGLDGYESAKGGGIAQEPQQADRGLQIPLIKVDPSEWERTGEGTPVSVIVTGEALLVNHSRGSYLGEVPPHYREVVRSRNLMNGSVAETGKEPADLEVCLTFVA